MATTTEFIEYVCQQIENTGDIRYRKMFGDYMVYVNDKPILLVCDNTVYVKKLDCLNDFMIDASKNIPYKGAKENYILDIDNRNFSEKVINILEPITPIPKSKKKKPTK